MFSWILGYSALLCPGILAARLWVSNWPSWPHPGHAGGEDAQTRPALILCFRDLSPGLALSPLFTPPAAVHLLLAWPWHADRQL